MALLDNQLQQLINTRLPLWQAPLPFQLFRPEYSANISDLGGFGLLRVAAYDSLATLEARLTVIANSSEYGVCFAHRLPAEMQVNYENTWQNIPEPLAQTAPDASDFLTLLDATIAHHPKAIGFTSGIPDKDVIDLIKDENIVTFAVCTNLVEAIAAADFGIDVLVLQGNEAGGIRATFSNHLQVPMQSTASLIQQVRTHLSTPIVAWGDYSKAADMVAAFIAGAQAVMLDRALLSCRDSGLSEAQLDSLANGNEFLSQVGDSYSANPMRYLAPTEALPLVNLPANLREAAYAGYLGKHPEATPLAVATTPCDISDSLGEWMSQTESEIRGFIG